MKILYTKGAAEGKKRVFLAVPSYGQISAETTFSLFAAKEALIRNNIESELFIVTENCHVDDGRNFCVRAFLESNCDELVFIDADIRFEPTDLVKLVLYPFDVVAGVYPKKGELPDFPVQFISGEIWSNEHGLIEVRSVPTGFLKIQRDVLENLYENSKKYVNQTDSYHELQIPLIFERKITGYTRYGGDYEFCRKWRELGGKIHIDPLMNFAHIGQCEYRGIIGNHLCRENGLLEDKINEILEKIADKTATIDDYTVLFDAWGNKWAAPVEMLVALAELPVYRVLEYGSGLSTLVMAASGKFVTSLENHKEWYEKTIKHLSGFVADIHLCSITNGLYDIDFFVNPQPDVFDCVVVDGPAKKDGTRLHDIPDCKILVVDDFDIAAKEFYKDFNFKVYGRFAIGRHK